MNFEAAADRRLRPYTKIYKMVICSHSSMAHKGNKSYLPEKQCATCGRPFSWRKKWAKNWDSVRYCSERCRRNKGK